MTTLTASPSTAVDPRLLATPPLPRSAETGLGARPFGPAEALA